ncbi:CDP-alcohol phosphatidyltransferase family protein [Shewanella sp. VB17]|uniref:CDP-alcohol phosphatidyltransferase family protein n=1 Tax=Shewanella sp. VB17 TaxID=2739432 RepID=UPI001567AEE1|nr:CDP-alcohol phosphatidyltransferase family protein [Shewanella sp. VB17]NRD73653.1 CDP-alcohol phosphatidyltransferase family protein [Shewanella sp. VB17]
MLTIYDLKPKFQNVLRPIVVKLADKGISANQVTWFAVLLSASCGALIYISKEAVISLLLLPIILLLRMGLNAIDGMLAREHNMQTKKGAMLNEMTDVISDTVMYLPLAFCSIVSPVLLVAFVIVGIFTEMAGVVAQTINHDRRYDGPMGKSDRAFTMGLFAILLACELLSETWVSVYLTVAGLLGLVTLYKRMHHGTK